MQETRQETPLLLSQPMVQGVIAKVIDRIIAPVRFRDKNVVDSPNYDCDYAAHDGARGWVFWSSPPSATLMQAYAGQGYVSPWGYRNDIIWVKEGFNWDYKNRLIYRADVESPENQIWAEARFMRRDMARLFLTVRDVYPVRLHHVDRFDWLRGGYPPPESNFLPRGWDEVHGKKANGAYAWARNPWVWRLFFVLDKERSANV